MARLVGQVLLSFAGVGVVLALATALRVFLRLPTEYTRKLVHILLSHWILLAMALFDGPVGACVAPVCFVGVNYYSYKKGLLTAIEREEDNSPGTVWYAVSLTVLCAVYFAVGKPYLAACGMLAMGWGDGVAALAGMRWGKRRFPGALGDKSAVGTVSAFLCAGVAVGLVCAVFNSRIALAAALVGGAVTCVLELFSPRGIDNLTVPLGVAGVVWVLDAVPGWTGLLVCASLTLLVLVCALAMRAITYDGMCSAAVLGVALYGLGGWVSYAGLILFFVLGSAVSRLLSDGKRRAVVRHKRKGPRSLVQVAANGGPALLLAAVCAFGAVSRAAPVVLACFAAACADTFASELGMLSRREPVSVLSMRPVTRGLSGGVTPLGLAGSVLGAAALAVPALWFGVGTAALVLGCGVLGSVLDSVLGAAAQVKYRLPDGSLTEMDSLEGEPLPVARGVLWMNNDLVNFLSSLVAGTVCLVVSL